MGKQQYGHLAFVWLVAWGLLSTSPTSAGPPATIGIQGQVVGSDGAPLTGSRAYRIRFFNAAVGGSQLGGDLAGTAVLSDAGRFTIEVAPPGTALSAAAAWYEVAIDSDTPPDGIDAGDVFPDRVRLLSVPFALWASYADTVQAPLNLTASTGAAGATIQATNTGAGSGVRGSRGSNYGKLGSPNDGVYGESSTAGGSGTAGVHTGSGNGAYGRTSTGRGVNGHAIGGGAVENYGGYFVAEGERGRGVYGEAKASGGLLENYGGYFTAKGWEGAGVYAEAPKKGGRFAASAPNGEGVHAVATGSLAKGVYGEASYTGRRPSYGGYFVARAEEGTGVYGEASSTSLEVNTGGHFVAKGRQGRGVYGKGDFAYGGVTNYGGYFEAHGSYGKGVYGEAHGSLGHGVHGKSLDPGDARFSQLTCGGYFEAASPYGGRGAFGIAPKLGVRGEATATGGWGVQGFGPSGGYSFYASGSGTDYGPFTGAHEVRLAEGFPKNVRPGMIVSATGKTETRVTAEGTVSLSSAMPTVRLCRRAKDPTVLGVLVSEAPLNPEHWLRPQEGERFGIVNALGEGRVWVSNINGPIQAGDYITASSVPGYGQRQDDDLLHSYTLGKAIETVDWDSVTETIEVNGRKVKVYLIAVVYTSG